VLAGTEAANKVLAQFAPNIAKRILDAASDAFVAAVFAKNLISFC
jgi:hypothetical protein